MLFQIGPLTLDTTPMEVGSVSPKMAADFAKHDLVGARRDYEFTGPGADAGAGAIIGLLSLFG